MTTELLTPGEVGRFLKVSVHTLAKWRSNKMGPEYVKIGRLVKYTPEGLEVYLKKQTVHN